MGLPVNRAHHRSLATLPGCICKASVQIAARPRRRVNCMRLHQRIGAAVQAAATGEAFLSAARGVGEMLTRHSMSAVAVWWLPNVVLQYTTLGIAAVAGVLTYYASNATWQHSNRHQADMVRRVCTVPQPLHAAVPFPHLHGPCTTMPTPPPCFCPLCPYWRWACPRPRAHGDRRCPPAGTRPWPLLFGQTPICCVWPLGLGPAPLTAVLSMPSTARLRPPPQLTQGRASVLPPLLRHRIAREPACMQCTLSSSSQQAQMPGNGLVAGLMWHHPPCSAHALDVAATMPQLTGMPSLQA